MSKICNSPELVKLLGCENHPHPEDAIPYHRAFPHEYVPDTITKTERFLNFEIIANLDLRNNTYNDITIYFFITAHKDVIYYEENGSRYLWYDRVVCELDNIFGCENVLGVGKTMLHRNEPYKPQMEFLGRMLVFKVKDFTDGLKNGR